MRHKKLKLSTLLFLGIGLTGLKAQTMYMKATNGTQTAYVLSNISKMSFSPGNIIVSKTSGSSDTYALSNMRYMNFTNFGTGISEEARAISEIHLFPNPVIEVLNIQLPSTGNSTTVIEIISLEGRVVYTQSINSNTDVYRINIQSLPNGMYICKLNNGTAIETTKFFKK